ncbi:MAG: hypothetical protein AVDCRST_MAG66-798, partial [uncultured Pseudonocardia sp.]
RAGATSRTRPRTARPTSAPGATRARRPPTTWRRCSPRPRP